MEGLDQKAMMRNFNSTNYKKLIWNGVGGLKERRRRDEDIESEKRQEQQMEKYLRKDKE